MNVPLEPIPAEAPISGPLWTVLVPALLFAVALLATWKLYRRFARQADGESPRD